MLPRAEHLTGVHVVGQADGAVGRRSAYPYDPIPHLCPGAELSRALGQKARAFGRREGDEVDADVPETAR
jgi:hypothetical protein